MWRTKGITSRIFFIYINDLRTLCTKLTFPLSSDDTNILYKNSDAKTIITIITMKCLKLLSGLNPISYI